MPSVRRRQRDSPPLPPLFPEICTREVGSDPSNQDEEETPIPGDTIWGSRLRPPASQLHRSVPQIQSAAASRASELSTSVKFAICKPTGRKSPVIHTLPCNFTDRAGPQARQRPVLGRMMTHWRSHNPLGVRTIRSSRVESTK